MSIEGEPKTSETVATPELELRKKEIKVLTFDAIKDIIISQIGNKAEINRLEIDETSEGAKLSAEIDAGMLGGIILIEGVVVNTENEIVIRDLIINARGYVKSRIENNLSSFTPAIRTYFERKYKKSVSSIQIAGPNLIIDLETSEENTPQVDEPKNRLDNTLEFVDKIKDPWERIGTIEAYCKDLIKQGRYDDARKFAGLIKNEKSRNATIVNINRIEKSGTIG